MKLIDIVIAGHGRITEGAEYLWHCYGENARFLEFTDVDGIHTINCVFDTKTFEVYEVEVFVPGTDQQFKWFNPDTVNALAEECEENNLDMFTAYDDVRFTWVTNSTTILQYVSDVVATYYDNLPIPEDA